MYDVPYPIKDIVINNVPADLDAFIEYTINPSKTVVTMTITIPIVTFKYFFIYGIY
jgi:hypothetical protein